MAARTPAELLELLERSTDLLLGSVNEFYAADLYASAAYAEICLGSDAYATEYFALNVPEAAVREGRNRIEVFEVTGSGKLRRLARS